MIGNKLKKWTACILSVAMLLGSNVLAMPEVIVSAAENNETSGTIGDNITWEIIGDTLYVRGTGTKSEDDKDELPKAGYTKAVIEDGITQMWQAMFFDNKELEEISIPDTVTSIGDRSFHFCESLRSITIPENVTSIGEVAFYGCKKLTDINIPETVNTIGEEAFYGCSSLTSIKIPEGVTSIGVCLFQDCESLKSVTIPNTVTTIEGAAFAHCSSLENFIIPESVTSIESDAFWDCTSLTSITIPESVVSIERWAFYECDNLKSITVAKGNQIFDSRQDCNAIIESATNTLVTGCQTTIIPDSVTALGFYAFYGCKNLKSITIPESITSLDGYQFYGCPGLTITIPKTLTFIDDYVFYVDDDELTIRGYTGSYAETFAKKHNIKFQALTENGSTSEESFKISKISTKKYGDSSFKLTAEGGSGTGAIIYSVPKDNGVLEIKGDMATIIGAGTVTVTATKAADNDYKEANANYTLTVEKKTLTPSLTGTVKKPYDGNTSVSGASSNTLGIALDGVLEKDKPNVSAVATSYSYADAAVGTGKAVNASGIKLQGNASANYTLSSESAVGNVGIIENASVNNKTTPVTPSVPSNTTTTPATPSVPSNTTTKQNTGTTRGNSTYGGGSATYTATTPTASNGSAVTTPTTPAQNTGTTGNIGTNGSSNGSSTPGNDTTTTAQSSKTSITIGTGSNKLTYKINSSKKTASLNNVSNYAKQVTIPSTVKDTDTGITYQITGIANGTFKNHTNLKSVTIGSNVETIGANAFNGCKNLSEIKNYNSSLSKVGKNAFKNIKKGAVIKIEAKDKAQYKKIKKLLKNSGIKNVKYKYRLKDK